MTIRPKHAAVNVCSSYNGIIKWLEVNGKTSIIIVNLHT